MIRFTPISVKAIRPFIDLAFKNDAALIAELCNIAPASLDECVDDTYNNLLEHEANYGIDCYVARWKNGDDEEKIIGFVATIMQPEVDLDLLVSFGINVSFRTPEVHHKWLGALALLFGNRGFKVSLWNKNVRAIRFFQKNGFNNIQQESKFVLLWQ